MSLVTVDEMEGKFETLFESITGITEYYADEPAAIQSRALPCVITYPESATYSTQRPGANMVSVRRQWRVVLLVREVTQGRDTQVQQEVKPFLTRVPEKLAAYRQITLVDGKGFSLDITNGGDKGPEPIPFAGITYGGAQFTFFTVTETQVQPLTSL